MHFFENQRNKADSQVLTVGLYNFEPETWLGIAGKKKLRQNNCMSRCFKLPILISETVKTAGDGVAPLVHASCT